MQKYSAKKLQKILFKGIAFILINAFICLDFSWAANGDFKAQYLPAGRQAQYDDSTLAPKVQIADPTFLDTFQRDYTARSGNQTSVNPAETLQKPTSGIPVLFSSMVKFVQQQRKVFLLDYAHQAGITDEDLSLVMGKNPYSTSLTVEDIENAITTIFTYNLYAQDVLEDEDLKGKLDAVKKQLSGPVKEIEYLPVDPQKLPEFNETIPSQLDIEKIEASLARLASYQDLTADQQDEYLARIRILEQAQIDGVPFWEYLRQIGGNIYAVYGIGSYFKPYILNAHISTVTDIDIVIVTDSRCKLDFGFTPLVITLPNGKNMALEIKALRVDALEKNPQYNARVHSSISVSGVLLCGQELAYIAPSLNILFNAKELFAQGRKCISADEGVDKLPDEIKQYYIHHAFKRLLDSSYILKYLGEDVSDIIYDALDSFDDYLENSMAIDEALAYVRQTYEELDEIIAKAQEDIIKKEQLKIIKGQIPATDKTGEGVNAVLKWGQRLGAAYVMQDSANLNDPNLLANNSYWLTPLVQFIMIGFVATALFFIGRDAYQRYRAMKEREEHKQKRLVVIKGDANAMPANILEKALRLFRNGAAPDEEVFDYEKDASSFSEKAHDLYLKFLRRIDLHKFYQVMRTLNMPGVIEVLIPNAIFSLSGKAALSLGAVASRMKVVDTEPQLFLTGTEKQVLRLIAQGLLNKEIARELFLAESYISIVTSNLAKRFGAEGRRRQLRLDLIIRVNNSGLMEPLDTAVLQNPLTRRDKTVFELYASGYTTEEVLKEAGFKSKDLGWSLLRIARNAEVSVTEWPFSVYSYMGVLRLIIELKIKGYLPKDLYVRRLIQRICGLIPTENEQKVLELIAQGMSNQEIALELAFNLPWVERLVKNLYRRFGVAGGKGINIYTARYYLVLEARALGFLPTDIDLSRLISRANFANPLTLREIEYLELRAQGFGNDEISGLMNVETDYCFNLIHGIYKKLGIDGPRKQRPLKAVLAAQEKGFIDSGINTEKLRRQAILTAEEEKVLFLICKGKSIEAIAEELQVKYETILSYGNKLKRALGIKIIGYGDDARFAIIAKAAYDGFLPITKASQRYLRDLLIVKHIFLGKTNAEIAKDLDVKSGLVSASVRRLSAMLGVKGERRQARLNLVRKFMAIGLIPAIEGFEDLDFILSKRERQVIALMALGNLNKNIAVALHITPNAVDHITSKLAKRFGIEGRGRVMRLGLLNKLKSLGLIEDINTSLLENPLTADDILVLSILAATGSYEETAKLAYVGGRLNVYRIIARVQEETDLEISAVGLKGALELINALIARGYLPKNLDTSGLKMKVGIHLGPREKQVLELVAKGLSDEEIAKKLSLSLGWIRAIVTSLYGKFGIKRNKKVKFSWQDRYKLALKARIKGLLKEKISKKLKALSRVQLSPRELEILRFVARGYGYERIAQKLGITKGGVASQMSSVYKKLRIEANTQFKTYQAVHQAVKLGIIGMSEVAWKNFGRIYGEKLPSPRLWEVINQMHLGKSPADIAAVLGVSKKTVTKYIHNIKEILEIEIEGINGEVYFTILIGAIEKGWISPRALNWYKLHPLSEEELLVLSKLAEGIQDRDGLYEATGINGGREEILKTSILTKLDVSTVAEAASIFNMFKDQMAQALEKSNGTGSGKPDNNGSRRDRFKRKFGQMATMTFINALNVMCIFAVGQPLFGAGAGVGKPGNTKAQKLKEQGITALSRNHLDAAAQLFKEGLAKCGKDKMEQAAFKAYMAIYLGLNGNMPQAIDTLKKAITMLEQKPQDFSRDIVIFTCYLGLFQVRAAENKSLIDNNYGEGIRNLKTSLKQAEAATPALSAIICRAKLALGEAYLRDFGGKKNEETRALLDEALAAAQEITDETIRYALISDIYNIFVESGIASTAAEKEKLFREKLELARATNDRNSIHDALYDLAMHLRTAGNLGEAIDALKESLNYVKPNSFRAGKIHSDIGALSYFNSAKGNEPLTEAIGYFTKAMQILAPLRQKIPLARSAYLQSLSMRGYLYREIGVYDLAETDLAETLKANPDDIQAKAALGIVLFRKSAQDGEKAEALLEEAESGYERVIAAETTSPEDKRAYAFMFIEIETVLGIIRHDKQDIAAAKASLAKITQYYQMLEKKPQEIAGDDLEVNILRAKIALSDGRREEALEFLERAVKAFYFSETQTRFEGSLYELLNRLEDLKAINSLENASILCDALILVQEVLAGDIKKRGIGTQALNIAAKFEQRKSRICAIRMKLAMERLLRADEARGKGEDERFYSLCQQALGELDELIALSPEQAADIYKNRGEIYTLIGEEEAADKEFRRAVKAGNRSKAIPLKIYIETADEQYRAIIKKSKGKAIKEFLEILACISCAGTSQAYDYFKALLERMLTDNFLKPDIVEAVLSGIALNSESGVDELAVVEGDGRFKALRNFTEILGRVRENAAALAKEKEKTPLPATEQTKQPIVEQPKEPVAAPEDASQVADKKQQAIEEAGQMIEQEIKAITTDLSGDIALEDAKRAMEKEDADAMIEAAQLALSKAQEPDVQYEAYYYLGYGYLTKFYKEQEIEARDLLITQALYCLHKAEELGQTYKQEIEEKYKGEKLPAYLYRRLAIVYSMRSSWYDLNLSIRYHDAAIKWLNALGATKALAAAYQSKGFAYIKAVEEGKDSATVKMECLREAVKCFTLAAETDRDFVDAYNNKGYALNKLAELEGVIGRHEEAIACLEAVVARGIHDAATLNHIASAYRGIGWILKEQGFACKRIGERIEAKVNFTAAQENLLKARNKYKEALRRAGEQSDNRFARKVESHIASLERIITKVENELRGLQDVELKPTQTQPTADTEIPAELEPKKLAAEVSVAVKPDAAPEAEAQPVAYFEDLDMLTQDITRAVLIKSITNGRDLGNLGILVDFARKGDFGLTEQELSYALRFILKNNIEIEDVIFEADEDIAKFSFTIKDGKVFFVFNPAEGLLVDELVLEDYALIIAAARKILFKGRLKSDKDIEGFSSGALTPGIVSIACEKARIIAAFAGATANGKGGYKRKRTAVRALVEGLKAQIDTWQKMEDVLSYYEEAFNFSLPQLAQEIMLIELALSLIDAENDEELYAELTNLQDRYDAFINAMGADEELFTQKQREILEAVKAYYEKVTSRVLAETPKPRPQRESRQYNPKRQFKLEKRGKSLGAAYSEQYDREYFMGMLMAVKPVPVDNTNIAFAVDELEKLMYKYELTQADYALIKGVMEFVGVKVDELKSSSLVDIIDNLITRLLFPEKSIPRQYTDLIYREIVENNMIGGFLPGLEINYDEVTIDILYPFESTTNIMAEKEAACFTVGINYAGDRLISMIAKVTVAQFQGTYRYNVEFLPIHTEFGSIADKKLTRNEIDLNSLTLIEQAI